MGITGLLPFLEKGKVSRPTNIKEFKGCTVAADAYCWLHKGAFSCADKLARGEQTDMYIQYCMKFVNMLLANEIKPILVFDGRHLPAKAQTEKKRRQKREENRKQAANLLRQGHATEALSFLRRCIDVTHKMALMVMQECRRRNVDCIVAPYEADAQLAYFSIEGIADLIITEDSDLLLFGCKKVMFKLDLAGNGVLVDQEKLHLSMGVRPETYSFDKFRYMCILSGCDYLDSLPGIGLGKACKFISRTQDPDIHKALCRLPSQLNIRGLSVSLEYRDDFMKAYAMFKHQLVFDPILRKPKPLTPHESVHPGSPLACGPLPGCVPEFDEETSYQLALGNIDPFNLEKVDDYDPLSPRKENAGVKTNSWAQTAVAPHPSIWDTQFLEKMKRQKPKAAPSFMPSEGRPLNKAKTKTIPTHDLMSERKKRHLEDSEDQSDVKRISLDPKDTKLTAIYSSPESIKVNEIFSPDVDSPTHEIEESPTSPILSGKRSKNPFARSAKNEDIVPDKVDNSPTSPSLTPSSKPPSKFSALNKFARAVQRTSTEGRPVVQSRYFGCTSPRKADEDRVKDTSPSSLLRDVSNTLDDLHESDSTIMQIYKQPSNEGKSSMVHRRPLFASSVKSFAADLEETENDDVSRCDSQSGDDMLKKINEKFRKEDSVSKLKTSPSKNPFQKKAAVAQKFEENSSLDLNSSKCEQDFTREENEDDVDDPGFESGASLTPCSPANGLSQPDDGFESPSKLRLPLKLSPSVGKNSRPSKISKPSCRTPGLKKPVPPKPGQFKLSAFGFVPKPKIQRS